MHFRPLGKITRSPAAKDTSSFESGDFMRTLPSRMRQVSFSSYSQSNMLMGHVQIGQCEQVWLSVAEGFLTIMSFMPAIRISSGG